MGGKGSGRLNKTDSILKSQLQRQSPITKDSGGEPIFLPNHSGISNHPEAIIDNFKTNFTTGSIPFSDGTKLTQDNSNLFWDDTNNRLGIGTASPGGILDISSSSATEIKSRIYNTNTTDNAASSRFEVRTGGSNGGDPKIGMVINGATEWFIGADNSDSDKLKISNNNAIQNNNVLILETGGNGGHLKLVLDNQKLLFGAGQDAGIYYDGSNMYINPQEVGSGDVRISNGALHLGASGASSGVIKLEASDGDTAEIDINTADGISFRNAAAYNFRSNGDEARMILNTGGVGNDAVFQLKDKDETTQIYWNTGGASYMKGGSLSIQADSQKLLFGAGDDASIYYDGTDMIINSDEVGSGSLKINTLEVRNDGTIKPVSMADASAANDSIYYSTTQSKLVYKDSGGTVNNLY